MAEPGAPPLPSHHDPGGGFRNPWLTARFDQRGTVRALARRFGDGVHWLTPLGYRGWLAAHGAPGGLR